MTLLQPSISKTAESPSPAKEKKSHSARKGIRRFVNAPTSTGSFLQSPKRSSSPTKRSWSSRSKQQIKPEMPHSDQALAVQLRQELEEAREYIKRLEQQEARPLDKHFTALHDILDCDESSRKILFHDKSHSNHHDELPPVPTPAITPKTTPATDDASSEGSNVDTDHAAKIDGPLGLSRSLMYDPLRDTPSAICWQTIAFENSMRDITKDLGSTPPSEVVTIRDQAMPYKMEEKDMPLCLKDAELRAQAYRRKLNKSEDLVASLFRDLERARRSIHTLISRNVALTSHIKGIKLDQEDNMVHRSSLIKACVYISPVFILCGGLEAFLSTIILVWVLVEIESGLTLGDDDDDEKDEAKPDQKHSTDKFKDATIPKDIVLTVSPKG
jgi:hypothetical protein